MIRNLNKLTFSRYGKVLQDRLPNRGFPQEPGWREELRTITEQERQLYQMTASRLFLDFEEGMTILAVSLDSQKLEFFYLDKPVCLKSGIYFALIPYQGSCRVRVCMQDGVTLPVVRQLNVLESFKISNHLCVKDIYTLFYQEKEKGFFFKGEQHSAVELTYIDKGSMHSVVSGTDIILRQGELMLYGENQWHMQYADIDTAVSFITISMDLDCSYADLLYNRKFTASQRTAQLLQQILEEYERDDVFSSDLIICKVQEVLLTTLRDDQTTGKPEALKTPAAMNNENEIIARALDYIGTHVYEKLSVSTVAGEANVSASYLTALFHKYMQLSPGEYIRRTKLEESKKLIREGKMNFTQIAQQLQYSTVHHFSRQFKEKFGITPTEYARAIR